MQLRNSTHAFWKKKCGSVFSKQADKQIKRWFQRCDCGLPHATTENTNLLAFAFQIPLSRVLAFQGPALHPKIGKRQVKEKVVHLDEWN